MECAASHVHYSLETVCQQKSVWYTRDEMTKNHSPLRRGLEVQRLILILQYGIMARATG